MKEYIEREAAINELTEENLVLNLDSVMDGLSNQIKRSAHRILASLPAADVVEVDVKDLRVKKAIQTLCEFYSTAKKSDYVQKPLAWALYQTWKSFDKMDGGVNDGKAG